MSLDGYEPTRHRSSRRRGAKCATKRMKYLFVGNRLLRLRWRPHPCWGRVEKGQRFCVKCRRVHAELRAAGAAPPKPKKGLWW